MAGQAAHDWTTAKRARQILFNLTIIDEMLFAMTAKPGVSSPEVREKASVLLERYDLGAMEEVNPFTPSARQQGQLDLPIVPIEPDFATSLMMVLDLGVAFNTHCGENWPI